MRRICSVKTLVVATMIFNISNALSEEVDFRSGPVLCAYKFNAQAYEVGRACYNKRDKNFVTALRKSVEKYRAFVIRNTKTTNPEEMPTRIEANERVYRAVVHKDPAAVVDIIDQQGCKSIRKAAKDWYNGQIISQNARIQDVYESTEKILAVDREPLDTGC